MLLKAGVDISRLNREIRRALPGIARVYDSYGYELTITSTFDGNHGEGSLHYHHDAIDTVKTPEFLPNIHHDIKIGLGSDFDVVLESDHIHIEYDPD